MKTKMKEIVNYYTIIHGVTGEKAQKEKVAMFSWIWKHYKIVEVLMDATIN